MNDADRIHGLLLGGMIGDVLGGPYEGCSADEVPSDLAWPASFAGLTDSDDTQLTIATCEAIIERSGTVDPEAIANRFLHWYRRRKLSGLGASTAKALRDLDAGGHWYLAGRKGERAAGNGAAMRIAPLAFFLNAFSQAGRRTIRDVCWITHHSDEAYAGALAVVIAIQLARQEEWKSGVAGLAAVADQLADSVTRDRLLEMADDPEISIQHAGQRFGASGYVAESVPLALLAVSKLDSNTLSHPGDLIDVMMDVIRCGGDTDTNASIFGQIAGALAGAAAWPDEARLIDTGGAFADFSAQLAAFAGGR
jgi:ADP-ribosyl-[dinitrogen reductase] hydrolase